MISVKKMIGLLFTAMVCICIIAGCEEKNDAEVIVDYGNSQIYTQEDMDDAIKLIEKEFNGWNGCELHSISYSSDDENNSANIEWMNDLEATNDAQEQFTQCIMFLSDFHSPEKGGDAWEPDYEYTDWQWWLARSDEGDWKLMTWGY